MVSCPICGPKLSICWAVLSVWAIVMMGFLGIFFRIQSPGLAEDIPLDEEEVHNAVGDEAKLEQLFTDGYNNTSTNCFIACGIYVAIFIFSFIQYRMNSKSNYSMS